MDLHKKTATLPGHDGESATVHVDHVGDLVVHTAGVTLPHYHLPGCSKTFIIRHLDIGSYLGGAPGGVLQGGRDDLRGLHPFLLHV